MRALRMLTDAHERRVQCGAEVAAWKHCDADRQRRTHVLSGLNYARASDTLQRESAIYVISLVLYHNPRPPPLHHHHPQAAAK